MSGRKPKGTASKGLAERRPPPPQPAAPDFQAKLDKALSEASPHALARARQRLYNRLLDAEVIVRDAKYTTLGRLRQRWRAAQRLFDSGALDESVRTVPRWQRDDSLPGELLRPHALKQQLREEEEQELELDRLGHGNVYRRRVGGPLGHLLPGQRDFAFGIYADAEGVEDALCDRWAGLSPSEALAGDALFSDAVRSAPAARLALMARAARPVPLSGASRALEARLARSLLARGAETGGGGAEAEADRRDLARFARLFDEERLRAADFVEATVVRDRRSGASTTTHTIREGTHLVLSSTPGGGLVAEAISPGPIGSRTTTILGSTRNPRVASAVFSLALGPEPLCAAAKRSAGHGLLWCANGLRFTPAPGPEHFRPGRDASGRLAPPRAVGGERVNLRRPGAFQLDEATATNADPDADVGGRMLLQGVRRAVQPASAGELSGDGGWGDALVGAR